MRDADKSSISLAVDVAGKRVIVARVQLFSFLVPLLRCSSELVQFSMIRVFSPFCKCNHASDEWSNLSCPSSPRSVCRSSPISQMSSATAKSSRRIKLRRDPRRSMEAASPARSLGQEILFGRRRRRRGGPTGARVNRDSLSRPPVRVDLIFAA